MKEINVSLIEQAVCDLCIKANKHLTDDIKNAIYEAGNNETGKLAKEILKDLGNNITAAQRLDIPVCQDTGMAVVFVDVGQDVHITGGFLTDAINKGVARGYKEGLLRCSVVADPMRRVNTNDNTPAIIHTTMIAGENIHITVAPKGFGSENMSRLNMFTPAAGYQDVIDFICETARIAGSNACPPMVLGVGIGGDFEMCTLLAKKALCRSLDISNFDPYYAKMEEDALDKVNSLNIGPQGFGGTFTALSVAIETYPTHIAGLPVAVNVGCHVTRHATQVL